MRHINQWKIGPSAYNRGCHCPACTAAHTASCAKTIERMVKRGQENPELIPHGTRGGYSNWGCKCTRCTAANTSAGVARRERLARQKGSRQC